MLSFGLRLLEQAEAGLRHLPVSAGAAPALGLAALLGAALFLALLAGLTQAGDAPAEEAPLAWIDALDRRRLLGCILALLVIAGLNGVLAWIAWRAFGLRLAFGLLAVSASCLVAGGGLTLKAMTER